MTNKDITWASDHKKPLSVTVKAIIEETRTNVILDTGAGVSVIDLGTLERLKSGNEVNKRSGVPECRDASGNKMDILGTVKLKLKIIGCSQEVLHDFVVLNMRNYHSIIIGRDIMSVFKTIEFDFERNQIRLGKTWLKDMTPTWKQFKKLCHNVTLQPRMEEIVEVRCKKDNALISSEFSPKQLPGCKGIYVSKAQVIPDVEGHFFVTVLNVNSPLNLAKRQIIGLL